MDYYKLLKLNNIIKNPRIKLLGLYFLHKLNKRYISVYFDPVNACNLRCKMCYFTDSDYVKKLKGVFDVNEIPLFSKAILKRALKLQIGCGTEPTLYKNVTAIILEAKKEGVPNISMTTNANLLVKNTTQEWIEAGLNEITISLHGVNKDSYENFMDKGNFEVFMNSLTLLTKLKKEFPNFKIRVNYTFNEDNFEELKYFWKAFNNQTIDILQIRPINKIGNTTYSNFSLEKVLPYYQEIKEGLAMECKKRNTTFIAPNLNQLTNRTSENSILSKFIYCYISPTSFWHKDFEWKNETYDQYAKRTKISLDILKTAMLSKHKMNLLKNKTLNYEIN
ncbi:radical SAM protein [Lutibacter sp. HS1-25]|uniref:radical SAM protein n=1 Tax=Lutibacter sp. HS1-25 TaxID=2485000 RepID=UPI001012F3BA|nr:radical SAM protein [Lutibacter sp. HS1-25]RXP55128.1 radical SAM protein [Lutibacter sp. HS1-25]